MSKKDKKEQTITITIQSPKSDCQNDLVQNSIKLRVQSSRVLLKHRKDDTIKCLKTLYSIISVISTLSIFSVFLYFVIGQFSHSNKSENNLIMQQIKAEPGEKAEIISIIEDDIHGFGNNSIIATTRTLSWEPGDETNKLIILDSVENEFWKHINDPFGIKSSYKTTFSYSINVENAVLEPEIEYILDIVGNSTKEILVRYNYFGSNYGAYSPAIFKYSYEEMEYQLIGTYPICEKLDLATYSDGGVISGFSAQVIETPFFDNDDHDSEFHATECIHENEKFNLSDYSMTSSRSYWANSDFGTVLVVLCWDWQDIEDYWEPNPVDYYINIYQPIYKSDSNSIGWNAIFSEYCDEWVDTWNQDSIETFICKKFNEEIDILTPGEKFG